MNPGAVAATGTRRARKKQRTRREIFDAALELFRRQGFDAVTIEQICAAADVARGTFFLHFPSKAALLVELAAQLADELAARLPEPRGPAVAEYRALVELLGARARPDPELLGAALRALASGPTPPGDPLRSDLRALIEEIVRRGQQRGEFRRSVSPRLAAAMLLAAAAAALAAATDAGSAAGLAEIRELLLHGLREPKPRLKWKPPGER